MSFGQSWDCSDVRDLLEQITTALKSAQPDHETIFAQVCEFENAKQVCSDIETKNNLESFLTALANKSNHEAIGVVTRWIAWGATPENAEHWLDFLLKSTENPSQVEIILGSLHYALKPEQFTETIVRNKDFLSNVLDSCNGEQKAKLEFQLNRK
ncbi:MAG: hypothetical protein R2688_04520 [Fimbriimonadaceae bacterium]